MAMRKLLILFAGANVAVRALRDASVEPKTGEMTPEEESPHSEEVHLNPMAVPKVEMDEEGAVVVTSCKITGPTAELIPSPTLTAELAAQRLAAINEKEGGSLLEVDGLANAGDCTKENTYLQDIFIAEGAHANVYRAASPGEWKQKYADVQSGQKGNPYGRHAIKRAKLPSDVNEVNAEANIMRRARDCPKVMQAIETKPCVVRDAHRPDGRSLFETSYGLEGARESGTYVGPLKSGDLFRMWSQCADVSWRNYCGPSLFEEMYGALSCFHTSAGYIHGDFKADNVMIHGLHAYTNSSGHAVKCPTGLQIGDFGLSVPIGTRFGQYSATDFEGCGHLAQGLFGGQPATFPEASAAIDLCALLYMAHADFNIREPGIWLASGMFDGSQCGTMGIGRRAVRGGVVGGWRPAGTNRINDVDIWVIDPSSDICNFNKNKKVGYTSASTGKYYPSCSVKGVSKARMVVNIECEPNSNYPGERPCWYDGIKRT